MRATKVLFLSLTLMLLSACKGGNAVPDGADAQENAAKSQPAGEAAQAKPLLPVPPPAIAEAARKAAEDRAAAGDAAGEAGEAGDRGTTTKAAPAAKPAKGDWNDAQIEWKTGSQGWAEGLALAKKENKPVVLVFYTTWCPHCHNFAELFHKPEVVEASKQFVMIRIDNDKEKSVSNKYNIDGQYIPRTYFLKPDGSVLESLNGRNPRFRFFLNEYDAKELLALMQKARA